MPGLAGGGLPDAEQTINADARGYLEEIDKINAKNEQWMASNRKIKEDLESLSRYIDNFERNLDRIAKSNGGRDLPFFDMSKIQSQLAQLDAQRKAISDVSDEAWDQAIAQDNLIKKYENLGAAARKVTFEQDHLAIALADATSEAADHSDAIKVMAETHSVLAEASGRTAIRIHETHRAIKTLTEEINRSAEAAGRAEASITRVYGTPAGYGAYSSSARPDAGGLSESTIRAMVADEASRRYSSIIPGLLAGGGLAALGGMFAGRAAGGGGPGAGLGALAGAIGGGIGNIAGGIGGMMGSGPTAADTSRVVTGFIRRWYPAAHWAMMLTNELLATAGPAVVAGGMGALTGMQGFEQLIPRGQAVFKASEALGPSTGMTTGKAWGLHTAYLQNAQDLATGMATEMAGSFVNMLNAPGAGSAFTQLGLNTDAMVSRFMATLTMHFQKGGLGGKLGNLVTGGTGYLQQFGDVLSNLGNTFLNVAPNLPGVGGDLLGALTGGTHLLASGTGWLGGMLGPLLAGEAGMRWGPAILGTAGRATTGLGNLLGNIGRGNIISRIGLGTGTEGGLAGLGATIGGLSAPEIGAIAAGAFVLSKGYTYQTPEQQLMGRLQQQTGQLGFAAGYPSLISAMQQAAGVSPSDNRGTSGLQNIARGFGGIFGGIGRGNMGELWHGIVQEVHGGFQTVPAMFGQRMGRDPGNFTVAQQALQQFAQTAVNALNSGSQIQKQWQQLSGSAISMGKATDIATMAQLQLGSAFQKNGQLSPQAQTMISNLYAGYAPMHMNAGMFGAAVGAQTAMAGLQHSQIASVNQAFDQLSQLVTGGAGTASTFFGLLGGTPVSFRRGGIQFPAPPSMKKMALDLGSFTSASGTAAWNRLTNQQSGLFPALEGQLNWLREAQTMNALGADQTTGMASYEMAQLLPALKNSPAALAMLSSYAQQFGGPGFAPGASAKTMFKGLSQFFARTGVSDKRYNQLMSFGTSAMANIGADANQFVQQLGSGIGGPMATAVFTHGEDLMKNFMSVVGHKGTAQSLSQLAAFMFGSGTPLAGAQSMVKYAAGLTGASGNLQAQLSSQLGHLYAKLQVQADVSQARAAIANLTHVTAQPKVKVSAEVAAAQAAIDSIKGKNVPVSVRQQGAAAVQAAIDSIHGKNVTVTITTINRIITQAVGAGLINTTGGFSLAGTGSQNMRIHGQTGMKIPGYGGGDIVPAMLEPGELVVPKHMVAAGLVGHLAGKIPGFQTGGFVGQATYGAGAYWGMGSRMAMWNPALMGVLQAAMNASQPHLPPHIGTPVHADAIMAAVTGGGSSGSASGKGPGPTLAQLNAEIRNAWKTLDRLYAEKDKGGLSGAALANLNAQIKNFWKTVLDPLYAQKDALTGGRGGGSSPLSVSKQAAADIAKNFTISVSGAIAKEVKGSSEARKIASELVNKIATEMRYATGVADAAMYGQGYDPTGKGSGIFGGMQLNPSGLTAAQMHASPTGNIKDYNAYVAAYAADQVGANAPKSVQDQMKDYLGTVKSFGTDITKLSKAHLNKQVLAQLIAAGPQQGDALAKSILGGQGGVGAVNKLWSQIQKESKRLGARAGMGEFGGHISDNLKHASASSHNININVSLNKGSHDTFDLTPEQVAAIVAKVQAALLKQAKKNNKTGVKAHGKGA